MKPAEVVPLLPSTTDGAFAAVETVGIGSSLVIVPVAGNRPEREG